MAQIDKNNLRKLLEFIDQIIDQEEDGWFRKELAKRIALKKATFVSDLHFSDFHNLYLDIKRTKYFLKNIDKRDWLEGFRFYQKISSPELQSELIEDYREMKIASRANDYIEFARRVSLQIENCINYAIEMLDAYTIIKNNPSKFRDNYNDLYNGKYSFFKNDSGKRINKNINFISFTSKVFFIQQYYGFKVYWIGVYDINNYRNIASHRGSYDKKQQGLLKDLKDKPLIKKTNMLNAFKAIIERTDIIHC